jgi:methyl-accepting chemotaxis protein
MKNLSLNAKIISILCIFIVASAIISALGIYNMAEINNSLTNIVQGNSARLTNAQTLKSIFLSQIIAEKNFIMVDTKEEMKMMKERLDKQHEAFEKKLNESLAISTGTQKKSLEEFKKTYDEWRATSEEIQNYAWDGNDKKATEISKIKGRDIRHKGEALIDKIVDENIAEMHTEDDRADELYMHSKKLMIAASLISTVLGISIAFFVLRSVSHSINDVIANLTDNSHQVTSAAHQVASSSEELSQAATEQASSLVETASSVEELNAMIKKNADNAKRTSDIANSSKLSAEHGKDVVRDMILAIEDINVSNTKIMQSVEESNQKMAEIVAVISEIGNKTKVINDIVFQTKLLSFNASVEAARAGENGKGFAVVAEEVGNLAHMSGNAAKEITTMLDGSISKVRGIADETKQKVSHLIMEGKQKVEAGTKIAKNCGNVLDEIVANISNVNTMSDEISIACQEQAQGVQEITKSMGQLDQVTQINAATSEQAASAAEELSAQAESLQRVITVLVETIKGSRHETVLHNHKRLTKSAAGVMITLKENEFIPQETDSRFEKV